MEEIGVKEATTNGNRVFVNLRIGKIAQTSKEEKEGFQPCQTENKAGTKYNFYAKPYDYIAGFVKNIEWHKSEFNDGATSQGWNITINTGETDYVLYVADKDRPYHRLMSVLANIDFTQPVRFVGFMSKNNGRDNKVLCLYQGGEKPVQPKYAEKWLSKEIIEKIREKIDLTEKESESLAFTPDGKWDRDYPYIRQKHDGKWSFEAWDEFLVEKMKAEVIPAVQKAAAERDLSFTGDEETDPFNPAKGRGEDISDDEIPWLTNN